MENREIDGNGETDGNGEIEGWESVKRGREKNPRITPENSNLLSV